MERALEKQKPYRDAFLLRIGLTGKEFIEKDAQEKQKIQNLWTKSPEFKEMQKLYKL